MTFSQTNKLESMDDVYMLFPAELNNILRMSTDAREFGMACLRGDEEKFKFHYKKVSKAEMEDINPTSIFIRGGRLGMLKMYYEEYMTPEERSKFNGLTEPKHEAIRGKQWHVLDWITGLRPVTRTVDPKRSRMEAYYLIDLIILNAPSGSTKLCCEGNAFVMKDLVDKFMLWVHEYMNANSEDEARTGDRRERTMHASEGIPASNNRKRVKRNKV